MESDWKFDRFHDGSYKFAEESVIKKYEQFLTGFYHHVDQEIQIMEGYGSTNIDCFLEPVEIRCCYIENTSVLRIVNSDNKMMNKIIVTFVTLCAEMNTLCEEAKVKYIPIVTLYGEGSPSDSDEVPVMMGQCLGSLQTMMCFINRCYDVIKHVIQQLSGLYSRASDESLLSDVGVIQFDDVYKSLAHVLFVLITLDELLKGHGPFSSDWEAYKRILTTAQHDPETYQVPQDKFRPLESLLMNLEGKLLQGQIFINCCIQNFDERIEEVSITKNTLFAVMFNKAIKARLGWLSFKIDNIGFLETNERDEFVGWCGLYGLHVTIFGNADKKLFKEVVGYHNKLPAVSLAGNKVWYPLTFLKNCIPFLSNFIDAKQTEQVKIRQKSYLQEKTGNNFAKELSVVYFRLVQWCIKMEGDFRRLSEVKNNPLSRGILLLEGLHLANRSRILCQTLFQLHSDLNESITRKISTLMCRAVEYSKVVEAVIRNLGLVIWDFLDIIIGSIGEKIIQIIQHMQVHIKNQVDKSFSKRQLDILSALSLIESMLNGPATKQRRMVANLALSIVRPEDHLRDDECNELKQYVRQYDLLSDFHENLQRASDCTFFYWAKDTVFPCYLENLFKNSDNLCHLQFILAALRDSVKSLLATTHLTNSIMAVKAYEDQVLSLMEQKLFIPISKSIESDLRVQMYSHILKTRSELNPFTGSGDIVSSSAQENNVSSGLLSGSSAQRGSLIHFIKAKPIRFFDRHIRIKDFVEYHLETIFYNLTAIYLSDWRTYAEMRQLAQHQYGLCLYTPDLHLPSQSLEQGRDILNIMRSMAQFSSQYVYNLNNQVFVEKKSDNKFLNTVNIRHVANSVRTHGWGIINTTINNAYIFLKDKFFQFSEFLYDDRIKGKLIKEIHEHKERCQTTNQSFPYQNSEKLRNTIRKMFVYPDGSNPLDRFRSHVTRMGNTIAFVRSVRSGALNCGSMSSNFLPDDDGADIIFEELVKETGLSEESLHSARNVDKVIKNLSRFFVRDKDYFKMFVDVFAVEFRSKKNIHCHNFYVLLPVLTLSFIDHIMECKDKLQRKKMDTFIFSDDGFAIGVAFILKVLDLYREFDSLRWFQSIYEFYDAKQIDLHKNLNSTNKSDENLRQTQILSLKRLEQRKNEFLLLEYSITSARIFFRADLTAEEEHLSKAKNEGKETFEGNV